MDADDLDDYFQTLAQQLEHRELTALPDDAQAAIFRKAAEALQPSAPICRSLIVRFRGKARDVVGAIIELLTGSASISGEAAPELAKLLGIVCSCGIHVHHFKALFSLLHHQQPEHLRHLVLQACQQMVKPRDGPARYFDLGGGAGLTLPPMQWPFDAGYCFWGWFRLQNYPPSGTVAHLFTFQAQDGEGIDIFFSGRTLHVSVRDGRGKVFDQQAGEAFQLHRWYTVCVLHTHSKGVQAFFTKKDEFRIIINGRQQLSLVHPFPRPITKPLRRCYIGRRFNGQIAAAFIFTESVGKEVLRALGAVHRGHILPDLAEASVHSYHPGPWSAAHSTPPTSPTPTAGRLSVLPSSISSSRSLLCLDAHGGWHASAEGNAVAWRVPSVQEALAGVGGVRALFPLFECLRMPYTTCANGEPSESRGEGRTGTRMGQLALSLSLLARFLHGHRVHLREMHELGGARILAHLLEALPVQMMRGASVEDCTELVLALQELSDATNTKSNQSMRGGDGVAGAISPDKIGHLPLHTELLRLVIFRPELWAAAPIELNKVLVHYLQVLYSLLSTLYSTLYSYSILYII
jgi:hypothetical protein